MTTAQSLAKTLATAVLGFAITMGLANTAPSALASGPGSGGGGKAGGGGGGGNSPSQIANVLRGPWESLVVDTLLTVTFNNNGTFTATIQTPSGAITADSGTWTLRPPLVPSGFSNPQANLTLVDKQGLVLLSGDVLLLNADQLLMTSAIDNVSTTTSVPQLVITKLTL